MNAFESLPETYSDKDLKMKLTNFYLDYSNLELKIQLTDFHVDWFHNFKHQEFSPHQIKVFKNKNNKVLTKIGISELVVFYIKCEIRMGNTFYLIIDKTSKIWLYRQYSQRILVASIKDINHLIELLNDPILMED